MTPRDREAGRAGPFAAPVLAAVALAAVTCAALASCASTPVRGGGPPEDGLLSGLLESRPDLFADLLADPDGHRIKIELVVVEGGADGWSLERHAYDRGPTYFYPASAVKTAAVIAAFERLSALTAAGWPVSPSTALRFHPLFEGEVLEQRDPSHLDGGTITAAHEARKVLLVSDNAAYNRLYELAGNDGVNGSLRSAGLTRSRILHRLSEFRSPADQLRAPAIDLLDGGGRLVLGLPERAAPSPGDLEGLDGLWIGRARAVRGEVVEGPMGFVHKNFMPLDELVDMNIMLLRPDLIPALAGARGGVERAGFDLSGEDRALLRDVMASTPGASPDPRYDPSDYPDDYSKFLLPGLLRLRDAGELVVRDKVGRAYGFSVTNSEVVDRRTGRSFFLAATVYTNPNGVVGDDRYDYGRADRFLADLGEVVGRAVLGD